MKIPAWLASIAVTALIALQGWALTEILELKTQVAVINSKLATNHLAQK